MAFTTQYLEVHDRKVAVNAFIQNKKGFILSSLELSTISSPAFTAALCHLFKKGSLKNQIMIFLIFSGSTNSP